MSLQLAAFASADGPLLADWSDVAESCEITTNEHGFATLTAFVPLPEHEALRWYDRAGLPWLVLTDNAMTAWRGRLEDVHLTADGIEVTALGPWSAFGDLVYNATPASPTGSDDIVKDILATVVADNPDQLDSSEARIADPVTSVYDEEYKDADMRQALTRLARLGDSSTPPAMWEVGVWEDLRLFFRPRGSIARTWYVDAAALDLERSLSQVYNSVYSRYNNGATNTSIADDARSIARYGVTRRRAIMSRTTDGTQADRERDAALADSSQPVPRASVGVTIVYDGTGAAVPLWWVRAGDTLIVRNLDPAPSPAIDRIRSFRVAETRYSCDDDALEVTPESPLPRLDVLVARALEVPSA